MSSAAPSPEMVSAALEAASHAYAPYSNYRVGACLKTNTGRLFVGCNLENAAYSPSICAESAAIATMVSAGERKIAEIVVVAKPAGDKPAAPCGVCRQRLREFADDSLLVHLCDLEGKHLATFTLGELFPHSFGPENLGKA